MLLIPVLATVLAAQARALAQTAPLACGASNVHFKVKTSSGGTLPAPTPGNATLVFIQDQVQDRPGHGPCIKCAILMRFGMDGQWIAATRGFSHTSVSVPPGDHHFCASSGGLAFTNSPIPSHFGLHVAAGKTYFLRARLVLYPDDTVSVLDLTQIDDDEGLNLASVTQQSIFTRKQ